jgi:hypothetical protein
MTSDVSAQVGSHRRHGAGVLSRYAPHVLLWALLLAIGLFLAILGLAKPDAGTLLPGVLFLVGSFAFLIPLFLGLARGPRWVRIPPEGVQWQDGQGEHLWRWEEIAAVFRLDKIINQTFRVKQLRLVSAQGGQVTFDQCLSDYDRLADAVQETVARRLLPAKRAELAGARAEFGPVTLHRDRITIKGKTFTWPDVEQYTIFRGQFVVYPRGYKGIQCEEVSLSEVPNYAILLYLLQELGQRPTPPQQSILFTGRK